MRWSELFRDLEGQFAAAADAALRDEVADRTRRELARLRLLDRLRPAVGRRVGVTVQGAGVLRGVLADCGRDWLLLEEPGVEVLVPLGAVLGVVGVDPRVATEPGSEGEVVSRSGLGHALRALARDRAEVALALVDGSVLSGVLERVGADHVEVGEHPTGERTRDRSRLRLVPFAALAAVRRR